MSHHDPAFTLLIFPSSETWQHRASAFPILSTSLATAATISYTHCSPPYPNSILLLHSFCHRFMTIVAKTFFLNSGFNVTWDKLLTQLNAFSQCSMILFETLSPPPQLLFCKEKFHSLQSSVTMYPIMYKMYTIKTRNNTLFQAVSTPRYNL